MIPKKENWRDNCHHCPHFDQCQSSKSAEECKAFLDKEVTKSLLKFAKDCKYYAISNKWEILATFSSVQQVEDYIKDHPNVFQIIYRRETSVNGKTPRWQLRRYAKRELLRESYVWFESRYTCKMK